LMDMIRTAVNVSGDAVVSTIVAKSEGKLDAYVYNNPEAGALSENDSLFIDEATEEDIAQVVQQTHDTA